MMNDNNLAILLIKYRMQAFNMLVERDGPYLLYKKLIKYT